MADTECSVLKFFDEVLNGEIKTTTPRWAGIEKINEILNKITDSLDVLQNGTLSRLDTNKDAIKGEKNQFLVKLQEASDSLFNGDDYSNDYSKVYSYAFTGYSLSGRYILDIIKMFGKYNSGTKKFEPENCTLDLWQQEYQTATDIADGVLSNAKNTLSQITGSEEGQSQTGEVSGDGDSQENPSGNLGGNEDVGGVIKQLNDGKKKFDEIKGSFGDINSEISGKIIDYSDTIDNYGKLGSKLVFTVLGLMNIALAVLILLICFCSGKTCTNCCCCRCIFKIFTHVLWNILALLMIITFLVGFLFSLVGTVGNDAMSAISYVVSKENLGVNGIGGEGILVNKLEEAKGYLYRCIHGDGKIEEEIGLNRSYIESFNNLTSISKKINDSINSFADMIDCHVYNITYEQLFRRENLEDELMLVHEDIQLTYLNANNQDYTDFTKFMIFKNYLSKMNEDITKLSDDHQNEKWVTNDDASSCDANTLYDSAQEFALSKCDPMSRNWIIGDTSEINYRANIISDTLKFLRKAKDESTGFLHIINDLKTPYIDLLNHYITTLREFGGEIGNIIGDITQYIDEDKDNIFDFINGKFIGTNLKIVLKYLKIALGKDLKTIGICLIIVGFALALSISSTILLLIVINVDIDNNKSLANQVPEYKFGSGGRVIQYQ